MAAIETRMAKAYEREGGTGATAIPWADIIAMVMKLFGGCTTPKAAKRWARMFPEATKHAIDTKLKDDFPNKANRKAAVEAAYKTFLATPDAEIEAMRE